MKEIRTKKKNQIEIITCSNKEIIVITLDFRKENKLDAQSQKYELPNMTCVNCIQMKYNNFVIIGLYNAYYFTDLFDNDNSTHMSIINNATYRDAIKINDDLFAMTSNKVAVDGEDNLILYKISSKYKKKYSEEGKKTYSFNFSTNSLALMTKDENQKILLCGCKNYFQEQENGILLFNPLLEIENGPERKEKFYKTENFEVYCFCPIFTNDNEDNIFKNQTNYFLVGGFDNDKEEGQIKLFKLLYDKTDIEFIQDIEFEIEFERNKNFGGFKGPISSIIQSKLHGNILATCYDGNVLLFSNVNLTYFKNNSQLIK